jgi:hypothetical protein
MKTKATVCLVGSIRKRDKIIQPLQIVSKVLTRNGYKVVDDHITQVSQINISSMTERQSVDFHEGVLKRVKTSDVVISECSSDSTSIGYLLAYAVAHEKPIIIFHKRGINVSNLFPALIHSNKIYLVAYTSEFDLSDLVKEYVSYALENLESRFNFYLTPETSRYLKIEAKKRKVTRSAFIRQLLTEHMSAAS